MGKPEMKVLPDRATTILLKSCIVAPSHPWNPGYIYYTGMVHRCYCQYIRGSTVGYWLALSPCRTGVHVWAYMCKWDKEKVEIVCASKAGINVNVQYLNLIVDASRLRWGLLICTTGSRTSGLPLHQNWVYYLYQLWCCGLPFTKHNTIMVFVIHKYLMNHMLAGP